MDEPREIIPQYLMLPALSDESTNIKLLSNRAKLWLTESVHWGNLAPTVKNTLNKNAEWVRQEKITDPLRFDMEIIKSILPILANEMADEEVKNATKFCQNLIQEYSVQSTWLLQQLGEGPLPFTSHIKSVCEGITKLSVNFSLYSTNKPEELIGSVDSVVTTLKNFTISENIGGEIGRVGKILLGNLIKDTDNELLQNINTLQQGLNQLKNESLPNKLAILEKEVQISEAQKELHVYQKSTFNNTLSAFHQGIGMVGTLLSATGNTQLANLGNKIVAIGHAAVTIVKNVGAILAGSAILGPIGLIGGAIGSILGILGIFGGGPSEEQKMLQQISKQIEQLAEHVDKRFDRIESMLEGIYKSMHGRFDRLEAILQENNRQIHKRFDRIEQILGAFYSTAIKEFIGLNKNMDNLKKVAEGIKREIKLLDAKLDEGFIQLYQERYRTVKASALEYHAIYPYPAYKIPEEQSRNYYLDLQNWAIDACTNSLLTGDYKIINLPDKICEEVKYKGIDYAINLLAGHALDMQRNSHDDWKLQNICLANPSIWSEGVRNLIKFVQLTPEFEILDTHNDSIDKVIAVGKSTNDWIINLKTNTKFFQALIDSYKSSIKEVFKVYDDLLKFKQDSFRNFNEVNRIKTQVLGPFSQHTYQHIIWNVQNLAHTLINLEAGKSYGLQGSFGVYRDLVNCENYLQHVGESLSAIENILSQPILSTEVTLKLHDLTCLLVKQLKSTVDSLSYSLVATDRSGSTYKDLKDRIESAYSAAQIMQSTLQKECILFLKREACDTASLQHMENYFSSANGESLNSEIATEFSNNPLLKEKLDKLNTAYDLLNIFIAFTFQENYKKDIILRKYLEKGLLNPSCIKQYISDKEKTCSIKIIQENILSTLEEVNNYLLKMVISAKLHKEKGMVEGHPTLDSALEELYSFKSLYFTQQKQIDDLNEYCYPVEKAGEEFKKLILALVGNKESDKQFTFKLIRNKSDEIHIHFTAKGKISIKSRAIEDHLVDLIDVLKFDLARIGLDSEHYEINVDLDEGKLKIISKGVVTMNRIGALLKNVGEKYYNDSQLAVSQVFFFKQQGKAPVKQAASTPESDKPEDEINTINCNIQ